MPVDPQCASIVVLYGPTKPIPHPPERKDPMTSESSRTPAAPPVADAGNTADRRYRGTGT